MTAQYQLTHIGMGKHRKQYFTDGALAFQALQELRMARAEAWVDAQCGGCGEYNVPRPGHKCSPCINQS